MDNTTAKTANPIQVLNAKDVLNVLRCSRSTLYKLLGSPTFPKPFKLGERQNAWLRHEVEAWIMSQAANRCGVAAC